MIYFRLKNESGQFFSEYIVSTSLLIVAATAAYHLLPWKKINTIKNDKIEINLKALLPNLIGKI